MTETTLIALLLVGGLFGPAPAHADVNIGIDVAPPPALVVASPPRLVTVPGSPVFWAQRELQPVRLRRPLLQLARRHLVHRGELRKLMGHHRDQPCAPARAGRAGDVLQDPARSGQGPEG